ncbi:MAG: Crp/Fnr family transcriptional regulator [Hyphomonadaceae bacterium]
MKEAADLPLRRIPCPECPLRRHGPFKPYTDDEISFINSFKKRQVGVRAGREIIHAGDPNPPLYTLFKGWAFRFKTLPDGRRQILNFLLPGDPIGFQAHMFEAAPHGVEALTDVELCVLERAKIWELYREFPEIAFDVTWLTAHEEGLVDENLLAVGQRTAQERIAALLIQLYKRAETLGLGNGHGLEFPLTQQHIADALGLSLVHTNKSLRKLEKMGFSEIKGRGLTITNGHALSSLAAYFDEPVMRRPLL